MSNPQPSPTPSSAPTRGLAGQIARLRGVYDEYPRQFWVLVFGSFIDRLGGALLFPFFSLYITQKFNVGMTQVGVIFAVFSITGLFSSMLGGALTDRIGRKGIIIFGLLMSALSALVMGLVNEFTTFLVVAGVVGLLSDVGGPAHSAMVADLLPEHKRAQGFGILRVVFNLAVVIGPLLGGILASRSYLLLFIIDTITSLLTAGFVWVAIRETRAAPAPGEPQESLGQTFKGYFTVLRDSAFTWFMLASMLSVLMYMQMNTSLAVFLRDVHGTNEQMFGYILALNAAMVVLFQFPITRRITPFRPLMVMVAGTLLYAVGFSLYGFVASFPLFLAAMVVITIGEMLVSPVSQAIVTNLAPEDMRGRYMATYGFSWVLPSAVGPLLAGLILDNLDPHLLWFAAGFLGLASAAMYYALQQKVGGSRWALVDMRLQIFQQLEEGRLTVEEAAARLAEVQEAKYARMREQEAPPAPEQLRVRVSSTDSGQTHTELLLPLGLVNIFLNTDCRLSLDVEQHVDAQRLRHLIAEGLSNGGSASLETEAKARVEISREGAASGEGEAS